MTLQELKSRVDKVDGYYTALKSRESELEKENQELVVDCDLLTKTSLVLKHLLDTMVKDDISKMAGLVTYGLKTVFEDQNLSFLPVITKKNEKIWIELKTLNNGKEGEFGSFGGSVAVTESFLLRVLCILKLKLAKLMLLDETFPAIGEEGGYINNVGKLVKELSEKMGMDILLVTHANKEELQNFAKTVYKLYDSPDGIKMEKVK